MTQTEKNDSDELVTVSLKRAIAFGGLVFRPKQEPAHDGKPSRCAEPLICRIPRSVALAHGPDTCDILPDTPPAKAVDPDVRRDAADKQFTGGKRK
ncbi:MAG TPA: hypothetical protein VM238_07000 [Phycisphaerae bacterium]|nr:hypothetical protein [Phycisphaerae bacterium]